MISNFDGMELFVHTAQSQSFAATAREFGITASAVSKSIARLETHLGVRLFQRSTRVVSLTEEGRIYLEHCQGILKQMARAQDELANLHRRPVGTLKIALPYVAGYFMPALGEFARRYPEIRLDLDFSDRLTDIIGEGFDIAVRTGEPADSRLVSRPLHAYRHCIVASPAYWAEHGTPATPADLARHRCLHYRFPTTGRLFEWAADGVPHLPESLTANHLDALLHLAGQGQGVACVPEFSVAAAVAQGRLQSVLHDYCRTAKTFHIVFPSKNNLPPKVRVFVDFMIEKFSG